jgi:hypothetical protein
VDGEIALSVDGDLIAEPGAQARPGEPAAMATGTDEGA